MNKERQTKKEFKERIGHLGIRITNIPHMRIKEMKEKWIPHITTKLKERTITQNIKVFWLDTLSEGEILLLKLK